MPDLVIKNVRLFINDAIRPELANLNLNIYIL
jgi:hypothetical protein